MKKIVVIGAGPAGLMAAGQALKNGNEVTVLDKNGLSCKKLSITGKGRCNVTNNCDTETLLKNIPQNPKFLRSAFASFGTQDTMAFFEKLGVRLKVERGNRVFPVSDKSQDIAEALRRFTKSAVVLKENATRIETNGGKVTAVLAGDKRIECDAAIIATGGMSYPRTGSTGGGYRLAQTLGHTIIPPKASLVPLVEDGDICSGLQGLSLRNTAIKIYEDGKVIYEDMGELLFTHFGLSGPVILSSSAHIRNFGTKKYKIVLDLKPALDEQTLDKRILRDFSQAANKDFANSLGDLLPAKIIPLIIKLSEIPPHQKVNSITKEQRKNLVNAMKKLTVNLKGTRPIDEAIVTSGGINTKEINPKTMQSKLVEGLYFAGEVIDVDAYTGGFNLQIAWATGFAAGNAV